MRSWIGLSLLLAGTMAGSAHATDWYTGVPSDGPAETVNPRIAIDTAFDGTSQRSISGALIGTIAPFAPLNRSGMRVRLSGIGGEYSYISSSAGVGRVHGHMADGSFMVGYEWVSKHANLAFFGGVEVGNNSLSPSDPTNPVKGLHGGFKMGVDAYLTPTEGTMVSGVAYYSTMHNAYYGRLKFGVALNDHMYIGPEVLALGDDYFQQWRMGGHVSGINFGAMQMGVSAGFLNDKVRGAGLYGIVESHFSF